MKNGKKKTGRKTKFTPQILAEVEKQLSLGMSRTDTMQIAGIAESTFYDWMKYPEFSERVRRGEFTCKQRAIVRIQSAMKRSWNAATWWLSRKHPEEFGDRSKVEATLKGGLSVKTSKGPDLSGMSDKKLKALERLAAKLAADAEK